MQNFVFEEAAERLEQIAEQLENGNLSLEQSIALYEEGSRLALMCRNALKEAQQKITEISQKTSGEAVSADDKQD